MKVLRRGEISERSKLNEAAAYSLWSFNPIPPVFIRKKGYGFIDPKRLIDWNCPDTGNLSNCLALALHKIYRKKGLLGNRKVCRKPGRLSEGCLQRDLFEFITITLRGAAASGGFQDLGRMHPAFLTDGAFHNIYAGDAKQQFLPRFGLSIVVLFCFAYVEEFTAQGYVVFTVSAAQQAVMPDLYEPVGQYVKQKPSDELRGVNCHYLFLIAIGVIAPPE